MYEYDIIAALMKYYQNDIDLILDCLDELFQLTGEEIYLQGYNELCESNNLCKICKGKLNETTVDVDRLEFWGFPCTRTETRLVCEECGNVE